MEFTTPLSPAQEKAINNKNVLKKLIYVEAVKLAGTQNHQIYYQVEISGIQNATYVNGVLFIREAESAVVKYKIATGEGILSEQTVLSLTPTEALALSTEEPSIALCL